MLMDCISVENMRQSDAFTIANHVPGLELMHRAAYGVYMAVPHWERAAIVVGSGNNGGDGYALACILKERNIDCTVFRVSQKISPDSAFYCEKALGLGVSICPYEEGCLAGYPIIVDCLLGTGFQGEVRGAYRRAIDEINHTDAFAISVDINSGMNGDTGCAELAVRSDLTVTIGFVKQGLITENAGRYMKKLMCADIGITLVREEGKITEKTCPAWLDRSVLKAY